MLGKVALLLCSDIASCGDFVAIRRRWVEMDSAILPEQETDLAKSWVIKIMNKKELENKVGWAFTEVVREIKTLELIILQHDLRKTQPEDKDYLELVLLELRERAKKEIKCRKK